MARIIFQETRLVPMDTWQTGFREKHKKADQKMFKQAKNIDTAFRYIRMFSIATVTGCVLITLYALYSNHRILSESQQRIFILANDKALEAYAADRKDNIPVEARDHIRMFHHYFFSLDPDEKVITGNIAKA